MSAESEEPQADDPRQLDLFPEATQDEGTMRKMRQVVGSPLEKPFEADLPSAELGRLLAHGDVMESVLRVGIHKMREELKRRGEAKLAEVQGCRTYGRTQLLDGPDMKEFHPNANEKETFYVGMDVHPDGASAYASNYEGQVSFFGRKIEREYPGYLVTWDGRHDHPVNLWVPVSKL